MRCWLGLPGMQAPLPLLLPLLPWLSQEASAARRAPEPRPGGGGALALLRGSGTAGQVAAQALELEGGRRHRHRLNACAVSSGTTSRSREPTHYQANGCWNTGVLHNEVRDNRRVRAVEECFAFCSRQRSPGDLGLSFFGIEKGDQCWCAAAYEGSQAGAEACSFTCESDGKPGCGGITASNVYLTYDCSQYNLRFDLSNLVGGNELGQAALRVVAAAKTLTYSTMDATVKFEDVPALLLNCKYIQGGTNKGLEPQGFTTNVPVTVYLAIDSTNDAASLAPDGFSDTSETVSWNDGTKTVPFKIFKQDFEVGQVRFQLKNKCFAGVFVAQQSGIQIADVVDSSGSKAPELVDITKDRVKYCADREDLAFTTAGAKYSGAKYILSGEDKGTTDMGFTAFRPVTVHLAIDGQVDHAAAAPVGFLNTGEKLEFDRGGSKVDFHVYVQNFGQGTVRFHLRRSCAAGVFITEHQEAAETAAEEREILLASYGAFADQTCGEAEGNSLKINDQSTLLGTLNECKLACWDGAGAMQCHGFTYDREAQRCSFHYDVLDGPIQTGNRTDCYFKIS